MTEFNKVTSGQKIRRVRELSFTTMGLSYKRKETLIAVAPYPQDIPRAGRFFLAAQSMVTGRSKITSMVAP
jgi:hypothetical protein